jgi:hypothetical protein
VAAAREPSFGETLARKGLGAATAITEVVPGATQAVAGLRSALGDKTYEEELARVREEQQMMRKLEPAVTGMTRGAGNVGLAVPAMTFGGPAGLGALTGAQALSRGVAPKEAAVEAGLGAALGPVLGKAPAAVQAALPVATTAGAALGAKDQSALWEAITGLVPSLATAGGQAVRGAYRGLTGRAEKAGEQILSAKGAEIAAAREAELTGAEKAVQSKLGERRGLTGEQQTRLSKIEDLLRLGKQAGMTDLPSEESLLTPEGGWSQEAIDEAQKAVRSFIVNSPEKFTSEPARVAAALEEALAAQQAAEAKWKNPLAVAEGMQPVGPVTPGPVSDELRAAAEFLKQRELAAARERVPEEIKGSAKSKAVAGSLAGIPAYLLGARAVPISAGTAAVAGTYGGVRRIQQLLATDPKTKLFKDPAAANVIYDAIPSVVRKFPSMGKYLSLATDKVIRARPVFLLDALRRDPDFSRAVAEEATGEVLPE